MSRYKATVNLFGYYQKQFSSNIKDRLNSLRIVLRAFESGDHKTLGVPRKGFFNFQASSNRDLAQRRDVEISRAFVDIVNYFIDFLDYMTAIAELHGQSVVAPRKLNGVDEIATFLMEHADKKVHDVGKRKETPTPDKLPDNLSDFTKNACLGYFQIRNSIVHHKSIADRDIALVYKVPEILLIRESKESVISEKITVKTGDKVGTRLKTYERNISTGEKFSISENEIEGVVLTLEITLAPEIVKKTAEMIQN